MNVASLSMCMLRKASSTLQDLSFAVPHTHTLLPCGMLPPALVISPAAERIPLHPIAPHSTLKVFPKEPLKKMCCSQGQKGKKPNPSAFPAAPLSSFMLQDKECTGRVGAGSALLSWAENSHQTAASMENSQVSGLGAADCFSLG